MSTQVTVVGVLGTTPERRTTSRDDPYARFRLASTDRRMGDDKKWVDANTNWYDVVAYGTLGSNALACLTKGQRVVVQGELTVREWTTQDGTKRTTTQVKADALGPDLKFGTASFRRTPQEAPAEPAGMRPPEQEAAEPDRSTEWPTPVAPGGAPVLVAAGPMSDDDPPF